MCQITGTQKIKIKITHVNNGYYSPEHVGFHFEVLSPMGFEEYPKGEIDPMDLQNYLEKMDEKNRVFILQRWDWDKFTIEDALPLALQYVQGPLARAEAEYNLSRKKVILSSEINIGHISVLAIEQHVCRFRDSAGYDMEPYIREATMVVEFCWVLDYLTKAIKVA